MFIFVIPQILCPVTLTDSSSCDEAVGIEDLT